MSIFSTLFLAIQVATLAPTQQLLRVTAGNSQVGCDTVDHYASAFNGAKAVVEEPELTRGCIRLVKGTPVKLLADKPQTIKVASHPTSISRYDVMIEDSTDTGAVKKTKVVQLWLSQSSIEPATK